MAAMTGNAIREALAPEGVLPLRVNELTPSVIICAEGSRISIQWREQRPDQPDHDEYGRAEAMAAFLVEAANRHGTAYDAIGAGVKALEWNDCNSHGGRVLVGRDPNGYEVARIHYDANREAVTSPRIAAKQAAAQADFERRVLSCLSTHTAAGAGPVGEAVAWLARAHPDVRMGRVIGLHEEIVRRDADSLFGPGNYDLLPLYARPVEELGEVAHASAERSASEVFAPLPGLVERITCERDEARKGAERYAEALKAAHECVKTAETALAETRERLEKLKAENAARLERAIRDAAIAWCGEKERETFPQDIAYFENNWRSLPGLRQRVELHLGRAALTGDAQEAGR